MGLDVKAAIERVDALVSEKQLSETCGAGLRSWLTETAHAYYRVKTIALLQGGDLDEIEDAFRKRVEFGTGGIRGKMGPGPNRINRRTIGEAAQGLSQYVLETGGAGAAGKGIVIAHDTRKNSVAFAEETACIAAGNGITAYLFDGHRATPELSFAVRELGASAGVVISASHNPPSDNGFKVYWADGGQVVSPHDRNIIDAASSLTEIKRLPRDEAESSGLILPVPGEIDKGYHLRLTELSVSEGRDTRIVYTPLHGVGATSVVPVLQKLGYNDLRLVDRQAVPDGSFPTLPGNIANPESPPALTLGIEQARASNADIVLASDPDADRLGCALPDPQVGWDASPEALCLNGNQIGALLCHHIFSRRKANGTLPASPVVAKTIVTTDLTGLIARSFGARVVDNLLVGFKYIGETIENLSGDETFVFGTEESHGYLAGDFIRDKDAAIAALLLSECAAALKTEGRSVRQYLDDIYREFGYFREIQESAMRTGAEGSREIQAIMQGLREAPPASMGGQPVHEVIDRQSGEARNVASGAVRQIEGVKGNVLAYTFTEKGHTRVTARPSGTEPKIKYYVSATSVDHPHLESGNLDETREKVDALADRILDGMLESAEAFVA